MGNPKSLTHLGLFVLDQDTGQYLDQIPVYAEVVVPKEPADTELSGRLEAPLELAMEELGLDEVGGASGNLTRAIHAFGVALGERVDASSRQDLVDAFDRAKEFFVEVLNYILNSSNSGFAELGDTELENLASKGTTILGPKFGLKIVSVAEEQLWSAPLGVLWSDHAGYLSFDLTRLPTAVYRKLTEAVETRRLGQVSESEIAIRALPFGASKWLDILSQGRFTEHAVVGRLMLPGSELSRPLQDIGAATMQNPSLTDWHLSPSSFAANPESLVGEDGCERLFPASLSLHEFIVRQVVRLSDEPTGFTVPEPYRAGYVDEYKITWNALGHSLGEILYSLPLAPGESVKLAVVDWSWDSLTRRDETTNLTEDVLHQTHRDRTITETVEAGLRELQHGSSFMGGYAHSSGATGGANLGIFGIGAAVGNAWSLGGSTATSDGSRDVTAQNVQRLSDSFLQASSANREINSTVVIQARQEENESIQTRTFTNYNHGHTLTVLYYEVLRHFRLSVQWVRRRPVVLAKYPDSVFKDDDSIDETAVSKYRYGIEPALLESSLKSGFDIIAKKDQPGWQLH